MYVVGAIVVIEMLVDEKDDRERHRVVKLVIKEWRKAKNAEPEICVSFIAIREHLTEEKSISFGHCPKRMGGTYLPEFFTLFSRYVVPYILTSISCYVILFGHF